AGTSGTPIVGASSGGSPAPAAGRRCRGPSPGAASGAGPPGGPETAPSSNAVPGGWVRHGQQRTEQRGGAPGHLEQALGGRGVPVQVAEQLQAQVQGH